LIDIACNRQGAGFTRIVGGVHRLWHRFAGRSVSARGKAA